MFGAYAENVAGVYGAGDTVEGTKQSIMESLDLLQRHNATENIPSLLKDDYKIVYHFDAESFLNYYKGIFTNAALEKITGINQRQLQHYSSGLKKPRTAQLKKIENGLHNLAKELQSIALV